LDKKAKEDSTAIQAGCKAFPPKTARSPVTPFPYMAFSAFASRLSADDIAM